MKITVNLLVTRLFIPITYPSESMILAGALNEDRGASTLNTS